MNTSTGNTTFAARSRRNTLHLAYWTGAWVLTMALATYGPQVIWANHTITLLAIIINAILGIGMVVANIRHLKGLDEMQQRITLEAMALTLGVGLVAGFSYSLLATVEFISTVPKMSHLLMLMAVVYIVGLIINNRRYQ